MTQDVFIALSRALPTFRGESRLTTWAYKIAMNHCLKHIARQPAPTASLDDLILPSASMDSDPAARAAHGELSQRIDGALGSLPAGQREVVLLHELHGLTYAECADVLSIPVGTVKSRLHHAFGRLRDRLGSYVRGEEEPPVPARAGAQPSPIAFASARQTVTVPAAARSGKRR